MCYENINGAYWKKLNTHFEETRIKRIGSFIQIKKQNKTTNILFAKMGNKLWINQNIKNYEHFINSNQNCMTNI